MKTIIIIVAVGVLLQSTVHANTPFGEGLFNFLPFGASFGGQASASVSANVINPFAPVDVSEGENDNPITAFEALRELFQSGAEALTRSVSNIISVRVENAAKYGRVLLSYIVALKDDIEFSGARGEFRNLERNLRSINNEADKLSSLLVTLHENRNNQIREEVKDQAESAAEWSSVLLYRLDTRTDNNQWARNQAENLVNEFIQRHFDLQDSCKEEALGEIDDLERNAQKPLAQIEKIEEDLVGKIRQCATSTNNRVQQRRCKRDINNISGKLGRATRDIRELKNSATRLNNTRQQYRNRDCVVDTLLDYNLEKFSIELKVEEFINQASSHPNQDPSGSQPGQQGESEAQTGQQGQSETQTGQQGQSGAQTAQQGESEAQTAQQGQSGAETGQEQSGQQGQSEAQTGQEVN